MTRCNKRLLEVSFEDLACWRAYLVPQAQPSACACFVDVSDLKLKRTSTLLHLWPQIYQNPSPNEVMISMFLCHSLGAALPAHGMDVLARGLWVYLHEAHARLSRWC